MSSPTKPRLTLFHNKLAGMNIKKKDGSFVTNANGEPVVHGVFNAKINLPEGLEAGEYEVSVYNSTSKAGFEYMAGTIKKAWKKPDGDNGSFNAKKLVEDAGNKHNQSKANGFVPDVDMDDEIPF
jgi:hypothetical protein